MSPPRSQSFSVEPSEVLSKIDEGHARVLLNKPVPNLEQGRTSLNQFKNNFRVKNGNLPFFPRLFIVRNTVDSRYFHGKRLIYALY